MGYPVCIELSRAGHGVSKRKSSQPGPNDTAVFPSNVNMQVNTIRVILSVFHENISISDHVQKIII